MEDHQRQQLGQDSEQGLRHQCPGRAVPDYTTDQTLYFYDGGGTDIRMSIDGGASFTARLATANIGTLLPTDQYTLYNGSGSNLYKSTNGGWTWGTAKAIGQTVYSLAYDKATGQIMCGGTNGKAAISKDSGETLENLRSRRWR